MSLDAAALDATTVALVIGLLAFTGMVAGTLAGLLGIGGGIVVVPTLVLVLRGLEIAPDHASHLAVATSLAMIVPTSISSIRAHARRGAVDTPVLRLWGPAIFLGALSGGLLSKIMSGDDLRFVFGIVALLVAVNMALPRTVVLSPTLPAGKGINRLVAAAIGLVSSLMGIGGGTLSVPALSAFSFPAHRAVGTAAAIGLIIAVPAVIGFVIAGLGTQGLPPGSLGYVSLPAAAIIAPVSVLFAPFGVRLAHALDARVLKWLFAVFLALTAIRMLTL